MASTAEASAQTGLSKARCHGVFAIGSKVQEVACSARARSEQDHLRGRQGRDRRGIYLRRPHIAPYLTDLKSSWQYPCFLGVHERGCLVRALERYAGDAPSYGMLTPLPAPTVMSVKIGSESTLPVFKLVRPARTFPQRTALSFSPVGSQHNRDHNDGSRCTQSGSATRVADRKTLSGPGIEGWA